MKNNELKDEQERLQESLKEKQEKFYASLKESINYTENLIKILTEQQYKYLIYLNNMMLERSLLLPPLLSTGFMNPQHNISALSNRIFSNFNATPISTFSSPGQCYIPTTSSISQQLPYFMNKDLSLSSQEAKSPPSVIKISENSLSSGLSPTRKTGTKRSFKENESSISKKVRGNHPSHIDINSFLIDESDRIDLTGQDAFQSKVSIDSHGVDSINKHKFTDRVVRDSSSLSASTNPQKIFTPTFTLPLPRPPRVQCFSDRVLKSKIPSGTQPAK